MTKRRTDQLSEDHLRAIGRITVNFSQLEATLRLIIWSYSGLETQRTGQILTSELSFRKLLVVFESLVYEHWPIEDRLDALKPLMDEGRKLNDRRNQIIHSMWTSGGSPNEALRTKPRQKKGYQLIPETLTVEQLDFEADRMEKLANDLVDFHWSTYP